MQVCKCCGRELPLSDFRVSKIGRMKTCNECIRKHQVQGRLDRKLAKLKDGEIEKTRQLRLNDFTPRELMKELKRRGYEFTMSYTETHVIKSDDL